MIATLSPIIHIARAYCLRACPFNTQCTYINPPDVSYSPLPQTTQNQPLLKQVIQEQPLQLQIQNSNFTKTPKQTWLTTKTKTKTNVTTLVPSPLPATVAPTVSHSTIRVPNATTRTPWALTIVSTAGIFATMGETLGTRTPWQRDRGAGWRRTIWRMQGIMRGGGIEIGIRKDDV
jgi:hypothetical protein